MSLVSMNDLNNAQIDCQTIAEIATSGALTVTDRLGNTKKTMAGAIQSIAALNPRGVWATGIIYSPKDLITNGSSAYICIRQHTSTTFAADSAANWRVYTQEAGMISMLQLGGFNDGITSSVAAFTTAESSGIDSFYLPEGTYITGLPILTKNYIGPGSAVTTNGVTHNGTTRNGMLKKVSGLALSNALRFNGEPRSVTFVGDSITAGDGATTRSRCYAYVLQDLLNKSLSFGQSDFLSGDMLDGLTLAGSYTRGVAGVGRSSVVLGVGASISFNADYIDVVVTNYSRAPGAGVLTLTNSLGATLGTLNCAGSAASDVLGILSSTIRGNKGVTYSITCSVASVEIASIKAFHTFSSASANPYYLMWHGHSGYATANYANSASINSMIAGKPYSASNFDVYVLAVGTNDIFNQSTAVSSAAYKANLQNIITMIQSATSTSCTIILTVPLNALSSFRTPVLEPFSNYRMAVYQLARQYDLDVMDLSEIDLLTVGATADGLHPNDFGHSIIASAWYDKLFGTLVTTNRVDVVAPTAPVFVTNGNATATMSKGGVVNLLGTCSVSGISKGTQIASLTLGTAPLQQKVISVPAWGGSGTPSAGTAILSISPNGSIVLFDYSPPNIAYISLDGASFIVS